MNKQNMALPIWCRINSVIAQIVVVYCVISNLIVSVSAFCPARCICETLSNAQNSVSCAGGQLEFVPIQLNPDSTHINLSSNVITNVQYAFAFYTEMVMLDLSGNRIDTLGTRNFESNTKLKNLNLTNNVIDGLHKYAFRGLNALRTLNLSHNRIEIIHATAFADCVTLKQLDMSHNNVIALQSGVLQRLNALDQLNFGNNQFLDVPTENFEMLHALRALNLAGNLIEWVQNDSFVGLRQLQMLNLSGNVITELEYGAFDGLSLLELLDVSDNNLTTMPTQQLSKLSNLSELVLSGNLFDTIPAVALLNLFRLRVLHLNRLDRLVRIDSRAFVDNTFLQSISLDSNPSFADLPPRLFHGNPNLVSISMRGNSLWTLDAAQFPLDRLHTLWLADNPLVCNCSLLWLWRLTQTTTTTTTTTMTRMQMPITVSSSSLAQTTVATQLPLLPPQHNDNDESFQLSNVGAATVAAAAAIRSNGTTFGGLHLTIDANSIGCDMIEDGDGPPERRTYDHNRVVQQQKRRHHRRHILQSLAAGEIACPAHVVTVVCAILSILFVVMVVASVLIYMRCLRRQRKRVLDERKNVNERIVPQPVDKQELERYLAVEHHHDMHQHQQLHHHHHILHMPNQKQMAAHHHHNMTMAHHRTLGGNNGGGGGGSGGGGVGVGGTMLPPTACVTPAAYRSLHHQWHLTSPFTTGDDRDDEPPDHYEKFDYAATAPLNASGHGGHGGYGGNGGGGYPTKSSTAAAAAAAAAHVVYV